MGLVLPEPASEANVDRWVAYGTGRRAWDGPVGEPRGPAGAGCPGAR
jgi:hypothetical protein